MLTKISIFLKKTEISKFLHAAFVRTITEKFIKRLVKKDP